MVISVRSLTVVKNYRNDDRVTVCPGIQEGVKSLPDGVLQFPEGGLSGQLLAQGFIDQQFAFLQQGLAFLDVDETAGNQIGPAQNGVGLGVNGDDDAYQTVVSQDLAVLQHGRGNAAGVVAVNVDGIGGNAVVVQVAFVIPQNQDVAVGADEDVLRSDSGFRQRNLFFPRDRRSEQHLRGHKL